MNYYFLAITVLCGAAALFGIIRHTHMLQQNSYYPSRYLRWVKGIFPHGLLFGFLFFAATTALIYFEQYIFSAIITLLCIIKRFLKAKGEQKSAVKPLVYTARVKRFLAFGILLFAVIGFFGFWFNTVWLLLTAVLLCYCPVILILIMWGITSPLEKCISKFYVNDAKKMLKSNKELITVGVTGSFGKTGVKMILKELLSEQYNTLVTPQSFNTPMGVVRTVRGSLSRDTELFVCEMGAKNKGDIKELCKIANPDYGIITSVGEQHLETFKTLQTVADTKFELADYCKSGTVFVNFDSAKAKEKAGQYSNIISYGTTPDCDYYADSISCNRYGSYFTVKHKNGEIKLHTKLLGKHNVINIVGAVAVADTLGVDKKDICFAVSGLKPTSHRLEPKNYINGSVMIDDAYNANPEGCIEAVNVLASFEGMKKVIITPGLVELGEKEAECNRALAKAAATVCDKIIFVGTKRAQILMPGVSDAKKDTGNVTVVKSFMEAAAEFAKIADKNTVVLVENDLPDNYLN